MDPMDIDSITEVPDTPDRLAARNSKGNNIIERGSNDKIKIGLRSIDNGSKKSWPRAPRSPPHGSSSAAGPGNSFQKFLSLLKDWPPVMILDTVNVQKVIIYKRLHLLHPLRALLKLSEKNFHANKGKKIVSSGRSGGSQVVESGKNLPFAVQLHSQQSVADSILASRINNGNESTKVVSAIDRGKAVESNAIIPPKVVTGQKRLVRNGCISPCKISRVQPIAIKDMNGTLGDGPSHTMHVSSIRPQAGGHARVPAANAWPSNVSKGKREYDQSFV